MKTFYIPLINQAVRVYCGKNDFGRFKQDTLNAGADEESLKEDLMGEGSGRSFKSGVWVWDASDTAILIHELSHFLDSLMEVLGSSDTEFRAYCTEWVIDTVLTWAKGQSSGK
ncbi:MAG TPA: hypothetical protein VMY18_00335 [Acidobacteriota bacterium]|nr:hypothetical protein [Acidobacteriota bacterium]